MKIETEKISIPILKQKQVSLYIKRIDKVHGSVSGNKWFKLKYNLIEAKKRGYNTLLTFGGAYSNHIVATSFAAKENGFKSIGIIRGEECLPLNSTLTSAKRNGMELHYVSRHDYRAKKSFNFLKKLKVQFGEFYLIDEGGTNEFAIQGSAEILGEHDIQDYICCAVGTGGTIAGIIRSASSNQIVIGFPAVKGPNFLQVAIKGWTSKKNWVLVNDYSCGGYAKINKSLLNVIDQFYKIHNIPLDVVYTGKMMTGILDLVSKDYFPKGSTILAIHTGGLQGNKGMSERLGIKLPS